MNAMVIFAALVPVLIMASALLLPLLWSGKGLPLGVHVSEEFLAGPEAQRILRNYTVSAVVTGLAGIVLAVVGLATNRPWLWIVAESVEVFGLIILGLSILTILRPHRARGAMASAIPSGGASRPSRMWLSLTLAALLPPAVVSWMLASRWEIIPSRFPVHWGFDGQPNGWAGRSFAGVFGPLIVGAVIIMMMVLLGELIPRTSVAFAGHPQFLSFTRITLGAVAWLISLLFSAAAYLPLMSNRVLMVPWLVVGSVVFVIGLIAWIVVRSKGMLGAMAAAQDSTPDHCWRAGLFYYNPDDPALMVPKRIGIGYTLNFAHPVAWILLGGLLIAPLALPLLLHHQLGKH